MATKILFTFTAEDIGVAKAQDSIRDKQLAINKAIKEAKALGSPYDELLGESIKLKREAEALRVEQNKLNKEFKATAVPKDSLAGLRLEYSKLTEQITKLSAAERQGNFGQNLIKSASRVKSEIDGIEQSIGRFTGNVGNYKSGLASLGNALTGGLLAGGAIAGITAIGQKVVSVNAGLSDSIADVAKAANTSIEFVDRLEQKLEGRNTRTTIANQLGIAEIGGKLGVAEQDLFSFVEAVDVVNVALGDQFGGSVEQTTDVIGKLRNVLKDIKTDDIGKDITGIGNALNFLEAQGVASAGTIADFAGRIGGVGSTLGVSAGQILGVSATLDELAVNAERGSSGFIRILQRVATAPEDFASAAGVATEDFKKLVNEDLFGAVQLFLGKLNDKNLNNTELQKVLKDLKLNGVGTAEVVAKLGQNMELLDTRVGQATKTVRESSSVTQEFEKKNNTLGASIEKVSNAFTELVTSSSIGNGLSRFFSALADGIDSIADASNKLFDFSAASDGASTAATILATSAEMATREINKEGLATEKNFNILRNGEATQEQRNQAISDLVKLYPSLLTNQQLEAANINQLNGLQQLATNVLRVQITERLKLRAKEQLEIERQQKQLRLIEIEATPDRALLGSLTAGETLRNFGTIDPKKLRSSLIAQFKSDIAQIDAASAKVDQNFKRLAASAEDNLSAAEQDALDLFRQFNEGGKTAVKSLDKTTAAVDNLAEAGGGKGKKGKKTKAKEEEAAAGSLDALQKTLADIEKQIEATPTDSPLFLELVKKAKAAKDAIDEVKRGIEAIKKGAFDFKETAVLSVDISLNKEALSNQLKALSDQAKAFDKQRSKDQKEEAERSAKERQEIEQAIKSAAVGSAQTIADTEFQIKKNQLEKEQSEKFAALDAQEAAAIEAANGNATKEKAIRADFEKKRQELERQGAKKRKELALKEAYINTALAVTKALTGAPPPFSFILAGAALLAGAEQIREINSQEFWQGGKVKKLGPGKVTEKPNAPTTKHGDNVLAYLKPGEMVLNEHQQSAIAQRAGSSIFSDVGVPGASRGSIVPYFASGGIVDIVPQTSFASGSSGVSLNAQASFSDNQVSQIGKSLGDAVAQEVSRQVKNALSEGLNDASRRLEREEQLTTNRQG